MYLDKTQTKSLAHAITRALARKHEGVSLGHVLDALAAARGYANWNALSASFSEAAVDAMLLDVERAHVHDSSEAMLRLEETGMEGYGPECVVIAHTGFSLRASAFPDEVSYLRVCDPLGREVAYWTTDEVAEDPADVLGAVLGALARADAPQLPPVLPAAQPVHLAQLDFSRLATVIRNGLDYAVLHVEQPGLEAVRVYWQAPAAEALEALEGVPMLRLCHYFEGRERYCELDAATLASARWDAARELFVAADDSELRFVLAQEFGRNT